VVGIDARLFPSLLASASVTVVFVLLSGTFFQTLYQFPSYTPRLRDVVSALLIVLLALRADRRVRAQTSSTADIIVKEVTHE
jgi:hypothetical protein